MPALMRRLTTLFLAILILIGPAAALSRAATTAEELVELMRAGLGDDVLVALIQTDGSTFQLSASDILSLHRQGLSDKVIRAMQDTAKNLQAARTRTPIVDRPTPDTSFQSQPVQVEQVVQPQTPALVNVYQTVTQRVEPNSSVQTAFPFISVPFGLPGLVRTPIVTRPSAPVYWGWGGQRRPDSWDDGNRPVRDKGGS